jgi:hypothetical protein
MQGAVDYWESYCLRSSVNQNNDFTYEKAKVLQFELDVASSAPS